jgi:hypothetical protein
MCRRDEAKADEIRVRIARCDREDWRGGQLNQLHGLLGVRHVVSGVKGPFFASSFPLNIDVWKGKIFD